MSINLVALQKAKETIRCDSNFDLSSYNHCIARHLCENDADTQITDEGYAIVNGCTSPIGTRACEILGTFRINGLFSGSLIDGFNDDRREAIERIDRFMALHPLSNDAVYPPWDIPLILIFDSEWLPSPVVAEQEVEEPELAAV